MNIRTLLGLAMALAGGGGIASAATIVRDVEVKNASFEQQMLPDGTFSLGGTDFWTASSRVGAGSGIQNPLEQSLPNVPDGQNTGYLNSFVLNGLIDDGSLTQVLDEVVGVGTLYTLSVDVGRRLDGIGLGRWQAQLLAGGAVVGTATMTDAELARGTFATLSFGYTGTADTAGQRIGIRFASIYDDAQDGQIRQVNLDRVRMTATADEVAPVPEPATWGLMVLGFGALGGMLRTRRREHAYG